MTRQRNPSRAALCACWVGMIVFGLASCGAVDEEPLDRSVPPVLPGVSHPVLPPVVSKELANGLKLLMVEHRELPVVNFILLIGSGTEADPDDKLGLSTLTAALLDEATSSRNALEIADQAAFLGASLASSSSWDAARVTLQTLTSQLDSALSLFADVVLNPAFPEGELERLRRERLTTILQMQDSPPQIADIAFARIVFGEGHPYGRPQLGTSETVSAITRADVEAYYRKHYRPNNSTLVVVGDFRPADMEKRIVSHLSGWERGEVVHPKMTAPPGRPGSTIFLVDRPGTPQSSVRIGHVGTARSTPDFFGLLVANTILGGAFTSRLNMNLREARGFSYGAFSRFDMRSSAGPFAARAEIFSAKTDSAVLEFLKELTAIRDTAPLEELEKAKRYLQLQLPDAFETTADIAGQLVPVALYNLPLDYYNHFAQSIGEITQADAQRVATAHIRPGEMAIVIVGDRRVIEPGLRKLGLGGIELRGIDGAPVR